MAQNEVVRLFFFEIVEKSLTPVNRRALKDRVNRFIYFSEIPRDVTESKSANYVDETVPGRTEPWKTYSDSSSTMIDFTVKFVADGGATPNQGGDLWRRAVGNAVGIANAQGTIGQFARIATVGGLLQDTLRDLLLDPQSPIGSLVSEVHQPAAALKALTFAQYDDNGLAFPPPLVDFSYGANFRKRGIIRNVKLDYQGPYDISSGLCYQIEASVSMEEVNHVPLSYSDVLNRRRSGTGSAGSISQRTSQKTLNAARSSFGL